jgi:flagellar hook-associated protein 1 FlgK
VSGILSTAISGLQASQNALRTTGHNISNANTAGYSRQEVHYVTNPEQKMGAAGYMGTGVQTRSIERIVDEFVTAQLRLDTSTFHQLNKYNINIGKVDKLFSDVSTGLSGGLQSFFSALQNGADDPSSTPARQLIVTQVEALSNRFNNLYGRVVEIEAGVNREIDAVTQKIGSLAQSISALNQAIGEKSASGSGPQPNDLLDQRDEALRQLSELVSIQVVKQDSGDVSVFIGNGQPLVVGNSVSRFSVRDGGQIYLSNSAQSANVTNMISGGQLGGLLTFREDIIATSLNELGRIAIVLSDQFNKLQQQGLDLDGDYGQLMFRDINDPNLMLSRVQHGANSPPDDRVIALRIDDATQITSSDYRFEIIKGTSNYAVTRISDNKLVSQGLLTGSYPLEISFDGLRLELQSGSFQGGDSFTLQPTRRGAGDIRAEISRPEDLAFASPVRAGSDPNNMGNGVVSAGEVLQVLDANGNRLPAFAVPGQLTPPVIIRFTSATTYDVLDNTDPANPVHLNPPIREQIFVPGRDNLIFSQDPGETRVTGQGGRLGLPAGRLPVSPVLPSTPMQPNGYPVEQLTFTLPDPSTGLSQTRTLTTVANASAAQTAAMLNSIPGVTANAFTTATITGIDISPAGFSYPLQISINGEDLLEYNGFDLSTEIPNPGPTNADRSAFNDYLAQRINSNSNLNALGLRAVSGSNPVTGDPELRLVASSGANLDIRLTADAGSANSIRVNDGQGNPDVVLTGVDATPGDLVFEQSAITVGGRIDLTLASGVSLRTAPSDSQLFGDSSAPDFAQSSYLGYQVSIKGQPQAGDQFSLDFNANASNDNRNALRMVALETTATTAGESLSFGEAYGRLVEVVGTKSNLSSINTSASKGLLEQTQSMRDSVSGVNLDEEAANLIKFEQVYNANARVISVARDIFDALLNAV